MAPVSVEPSPRVPLQRWHIVALALLLAAMVVGAMQLAFLCDDAFITFRYVHNAHHGHGLVWNPPPFRPVEGYTGFSWAMLLWAVWSWFGVEPPAAANVLSIACGIGQFALVALAASRLRRSDGGAAPTAIGLLVIAAIVGNRTFLQWLTSGLETALFNLAVIGWVLLGFRAREGRTTGWLARWSAFAALAALTRPDGLLLVAATAATTFLALVQRERPRGRSLLGLAPLLLVVAHLIWRRCFYGEWLPNTYFAKVTASWPEAGMRYFACFAVEHGVWLWVPLAVAWLVGEARRAGRSLVPTLRQQMPALAAVTTIVFHTAYYVLEVGGDHFEYRVFSHLVPLGALAGAAMALRLWRRPLVTAMVVGGLWLGSGIGWLHLALTSDMPGHGFRPIARSVPAIARPLAHWFDQQQAWLFFRYIGLRCNHHRALLDGFQARFGRRMEVVGSTDPFPVFRVGAVGCAGWSLPFAVLLDTHGLNDWVVARTPVDPPGPTMSPADVRAFVTAANTNHDDRLDVAELRALFVRVGAGRATEEFTDHLVAIAMTLCAGAPSDALTLAETDGLGAALASPRRMAHERQPPPGYVEAFEPNVSVENGLARATPRQVPLSAERVRAIETEWWAKVRAGQPH